MTDTRSTISIVMPTFNGMGTIELALDSIFTRTTFPDFEVIVVDDGSTDGTRRFVEDYMAVGGRTNLRYVRLDANHGICTALNVGYRMAGASDVVRVDNDIEILTGDWLELFLDTAYSEPSIGIVHCCPILDDGSIHVFEIKTISADSRIPETGVLHDPETHNRVFEVEAAWLMCAFVKNAVIRNCLNDVAYNPVWFEDIDYCIQARYAGFQVMCDQRVKTAHHQAIRNRTEMFERCEVENTAERNREYLQRKWWGLRVPVTGPGWRDAQGLGPDYAFIAREYKDCPQIVKFLPEAYGRGNWSSGLDEC